MIWTVLVDLDLDDLDTLERVRQQLVDCLESETGTRPKTRTIRSDHLSLILEPELPEYVPPNRRNS